MKIRNKYSKKRWNLRMYLMILNMRFLRYLHKLFPGIDLLKGIDFEIGKRDFDFEGIKLTLEHINVFEIVLNEDLLGNVNNIVRMIDKNRPQNYLLAKQPDQVRATLQEILSSSYVKSWNKLGIVQFDNNKTLEKYVKFIEISVITISGSFSIISMDMFLNDSIASDIRRRILSNIRSLSYKGRIRRFELFKIKRISFGGQISNEATKRIIIDDMITQLKTECIGEVAKYVNLYFNDCKICAPSFNAFSTNIEHYDNSDVARHLWKSLGLDNYRCELRKDGVWALFVNDESIRDYMRYNNYPIVFRDEYHDTLSDNYRHHIDIMMSYIGYQYFFIPIYNTFIHYYENAFTANRNNFYKKIKGVDLGLASWIKLKMQIDKFDFMFNRMYETVSDDYYQRLIKEEERNCARFNSKFRKGTILKNHWDSIVDFYEEIEVSRMRLVKDINLYINSITSKSNLVYNTKSIWLMVITAIISLLSVVVALYSVLVATGSI